MEKILEQIILEQDKALRAEMDADATIVLATGEKVTGIIERLSGGVVTVRRLSSGGETYAEIPRHYATSAVIGAYYTDGS